MVREDKDMAPATKPVTIVDEAPESAAVARVCVMTADGTVIKQAANVATTGTVEDVVNALVAAGLMAAPATE